MNWPGGSGFIEKPIVIIEDNCYHLQEILDRLEELQSPWLSQITLVSLDRPGPDTTHAALTWLERFPELQVVSTMIPQETPEPDLARRLVVLSDDLLGNHHQFCKAMVRLLRPGGLLVQDIQLDTLKFLSREEWWTSIYLASTIRGMIPGRIPACRFMSNKSGFGIGFGRDLIEAGFDPREVIDKSQLAGLIVPVLDEFMDQAFPLELELCQSDQEPISLYVSREDQTQINSSIDLVWWCDRQRGPELSGLRVAGGRLVRPKSHEQHTWQALFDDYFDAGTGVLVENVGARLAPEGALKAERSNAAARHIHGLRARLNESEAIVTDQSAYHIDRELSVARVLRARQTP